VIGGLATIAFGSVAVLATQSLARLAGASVLVSSGTLLAAVGVGQVAVTGGALFYLASAVLAFAALFLLIELVERGRAVGADVLAVTREAYGEGEEDELDEAEVGIAIPAMTAILAISFMACALLISGLPPLSGFLGKFAILAPLFDAGGIVAASWFLLAVLLLSGLATVIAMMRAGIDAFWASPAEATPRVHVFEIGPVLLLLALCGAMTVQAAPVMHYMQATAQSLHAPQDYVRGVAPARYSGAPDHDGAQ
jgi:multicomponent K+:H+ antiporter subunit D